MQNTLVMSGWGGINAGKKVDRLANARGNIRQRESWDTQAVFENTRPGVEFRSLSLDTWEPLERAVESSYFGAIAIQAIDRHVTEINTSLLRGLKAESPEKFYQLLQKKGLIKEETDDVRIKKSYPRRFQHGYADLDDHNENFLQNEMYGYYEDTKGNWVDAREFGGEANKNRFIAMVKNEQALEAYAEHTRIDPSVLFFETTPDLANKLTAITNLFIKSSKDSVGDAVNASSSLDTTKIGRTVETADSQAKFQSFFDANGKTREGYYYVQGGSERMILHKTQMRLLEFNKSMQNIII